MEKKWQVRYDERTQQVCVFDSERKTLIASVDAEDVDAVPACTMLEIAYSLGLDLEEDEKLLGRIEEEIFNAYY